MNATRGGPAAGAISRNAAWLLAGRVLAQALTVAFAVILARRLGPAGFGAYAFVVAIVFLANVVTTFGTDMVLIREVAAGGRTDRWSAALAVQLGLSALAIAGAWLVAPLAAPVGGGVAGALRLYSLSLVPAALFSVCSAVLRGLGRMAWYAALGVAAAALQLGALLVLPPTAPLEGVMAALLAVQVAVAILAWLVTAACSPALRAVPRASGADVVEMVRATGRIGILGLLGVAYQRAPVIALAAVAGPVATGWYAGASKIVEASKTGHVALFGALYPAMAEAHGRDAAAGDGVVSRGARRPSDVAGALDGTGPRDATRPGDPTRPADTRPRDSQVLRWSRISLAAGALLSAGLVAASPFAARALFGPSFAPSEAGLAILALSLVPSTLSTYQSLDLVARHREAATLRAQLLSLATLGGLLAALVPTIGWTGACWAVLFAEVVQAAALFAVSREVHVAPSTPSAMAVEQGARPALPSRQAGAAR